MKFSISSFNIDFHSKMKSGMFYYKKLERCAKKMKLLNFWSLFIIKFMKNTFKISKTNQINLEILLMQTKINSSTKNINK